MQAYNEGAPRREPLKIPMRVCRQKRAAYLRRAEERRVTRIGDWVAPTYAEAAGTAEAVEHGQSSHDLRLCTRYLIRFRTEY